MRKRTCKNPKFDVIVCCQGQPFHYYCSTLIGALVEYGYQYMKNKKYGTMNFSLKQRLCETVHQAMQLSDYGKCAEEHRQLAEWLKDYKRLKEQEPSDDAISRQAVLEQIDQWAIGNREYLPTNAMHYLIRRIQDISPVTPKTGHWIKMLLTDMSDIAGQCSECGFIHKFIGGHTAQYNYCPNCGARMQESEG